MSESVKTLLSFALGVLSVVLTALLWTSPTVLVVVLVLVALAMLYVEKHTSAISLYFVVFFLGPLFETLPLYFGAWTYTEPHLLGVPMWLPFL